MGDDGDTFRTRHTPLLKAVVKSSADTRELSSTACLTYPVHDLAGDIVRPDGLNFGPHRMDPWVDLEHGRNPDLRSSPVGWCRKSLGSLGGEYAVNWSNQEIQVGDLHETHKLPFATTYFDPNNRVSSQTFALIEKGALPGVSLEFRPVPGYCKALGRSPIEPRMACDFIKADVVRYTLCATPVCPGALILTDGVIRKALMPPDPLLKILTDRRVGSEPLDKFIFKSLAHHLPAKRTVVRVEKAMDQQQIPAMGGDTVYDDAADDAGMTDDSNLTATAQAAYDFAQGAADLCAQVQDSIAKGEHKKGKAKLLSLCEKLEAMSEAAMQIGQMVESDVGGDDTGGGDGDDSDAEESDEEPELDDDATDKDDDGVLKGIPQTYKKSVRRFSFADLQDQETPAAKPELTAEDLAKIDSLARQLKRLNNKLSLR